ncbi:MAG: GtrA family protein [Rhodospirillaceae bacterium]|nr:GtrA family protein [Rhodospirillaceae bacterium]
MTARRGLAAHGPRALRFAAVGVANTAIDMALFAVLYYLAGWAVLPAHIAGFLVAATNSYLMNKTWTFADDSRGRAALVKGIGFLAVAGVGLALSSATIWLVAGLVPVLVAKVLAIVASFLWNYIASHLLVFRGA